MLPPDEDEEIQANAGQWPKKGLKSAGDDGVVPAVVGQHVNGHAMCNGASNGHDAGEIQLGECCWRFCMRGCVYACVRACVCVCVCVCVTVWL